MQQSNGALKIDSHVGAGTAVHLYLPRTSLAPEAEEEPRAAREAEPADARILVVDDDPDVRQVTVEMLRQIGYRVASVDGGQAALDALDQGNVYDLLVVDIAMPGLTGVETVRRARAKWPELRVLYATGYADAAGGDDLTDDDPRIKKPFRLAELTAEIHAAIAKR